MRTRKVELFVYLYYLKYEYTALQYMFINYYSKIIFNSLRNIKTLKNKNFIIQVRKFLFSRVFVFL